MQRLQFNDCMLESRRHLKLNTRRCSTPPAPILCMRSRCRTTSSAITDLALTSTSSACAPLGPSLHLSLSLLPTFPSLASTSSTPSPFLVSTSPSPASPLVTSPLRTRIDPSMPAGIVCPRALPVQDLVYGRASAGPDLPARSPARAVGSAHTVPPILPSSSTHFPSHLNPPCAARLWTSPPTRDLAIRPCALRDWPRAMQPRFAR
ncbi:hypothetical protein B0H14DRAFT_2962591 [Mycena olivaceomarginata]|nr:hypothetical protein B0H14DRAFT_2962591 [Mycena olivaceomarginata]